MDKVLLPRRLVAACSASALLLMTACNHTSVLAPHPGVSGAVVLVGHLTNPAGQPTGTRVVSDADGIRVDLVGAAGVVATTTTVRGRYTFTDLPRGSYRALTQVTPDLLAETHLLTVGDAMVEAADTLRLQSRGDLYTWPNPSAGSSFTTFNILALGPDTLRVLDRTGAVVRVVIKGQLPLGQNGMPWDGAGSNGVQVAPGLYWLSLAEAFGTRDQLLIRQ